MGSSSKRYYADGAYTRGGRGRPPLVVAVSILILLTGALVWLLGSRLTAGHAASTQSSATLSKEPQTARLFIGGNDLVIAEEVAGISGTGLGAFSFTVLFSKQIVDVSISEGPFLSSTGRTTRCFLSPLENRVQFSCNSVGARPGPTGSGVLAFIAVRPKPGLMLRPTAGNGIIAVLDNLSGEAALSDPLGESIPVGKVLDAVVTIRALEADLNRDCVVDVVDEQIISYRYQATFGSLLYNLFYDLEPSVAPDGDIDIKDLQFVYGRDGTACEGVTPPTPTPTATATPTSTPTSTGTPATATPTSTGTPATATPTPTPTSIATPATATPTGTGTPATATPTSIGTPATATPTSTGTPAAATPTSTGTPATATPTPTATPVFAGTKVPAAMTQTPTPSFVVRVLPTAITSPTAAVRALPPAGSGSADSPPWTTISGMALALGGMLFLCAGILLRSRAAPSRAQVDGRESRYLEALARFHASLQNLLAALETRRQDRPKKWTMGKGGRGSRSCLGDALPRRKGRQKQW